MNLFYLVFNLLCFSVAGTGGAGELGANQKKLVIIERSLLLYKILFCKHPNKLTLNVSDFLKLSLF